MMLTPEQLKDLDRLAELMSIEGGKDSREFIDLAVKNVMWLDTYNKEVTDAIEAVKKKYQIGTDQ
jgi:hypothetical protein